MRKAKKSVSERAGPKKRPAAKRASPRQQTAADPVPPPALTGTLPNPPQHAPMQREYLRILIGKECSPASGDGQQPAGNYATRLLTFAVRNRGI